MMIMTIRWGRNYCIGEREVKQVWTVNYFKSPSFAQHTFNLISETRRQREGEGKIHGERQTERERKRKRIESETRAEIQTKRGNQQNFRYIESIHFPFPFQSLNPIENTVDMMGRARRLRQKFENWKRERKRESQAGNHHLVPCTLQFLHRSQSQRSRKWNKNEKRDTWNGSKCPVVKFSPESGKYQMYLRCKRHRDRKRWRNGKKEKNKFLNTVPWTNQVSHSEDDFEGDKKGRREEILELTPSDQGKNQKKQQTSTIPALDPSSPYLWPDCIPALDPSSPCLWPDCIPAFDPWSLLWYDQRKSKCTIADPSQVHQPWVVCHFHRDVFWHQITEWPQLIRLFHPSLWSSSTRRLKQRLKYVDSRTRQPCSWGVRIVTTRKLIIVGGFCVQHIQDTDKGSWLMTSKRSGSWPTWRLAVDPFRRRKKRIFATWLHLVRMITDLKCSSNLTHGM